jgi:hypothetical protein
MAPLAAAANPISPAVAIKCPCPTVGKRCVYCCGDRPLHLVGRRSRESSIRLLLLRDEKLLLVKQWLMIPPTRRPLRAREQKKAVNDFRYSRVRSQILIASNPLLGTRGREFGAVLIAPNPLLRYCGARTADRPAAGEIIEVGGTPRRGAKLSTLKLTVEELRAGQYGVLQTIMPFSAAQGSPDGSAYHSGFDRPCAYVKTPSVEPDGS